MTDPSDIDVLAFDVGGTVIDWGREGRAGIHCRGVAVAGFGLF